MKDVFWNTKHYDLRSWISTCGCSLSKDGRRRRKRGIHNPLDLGRYPLNVVSVDLYSWLSQVYLTLVDLYSDKISAFQIYGKLARVVTETFEIFCDAVGFPTEVLTDLGGEFVGLKDLVSLHRELLLTGHSRTVGWRGNTEKLIVCAEQMTLVLWMECSC